MTEMWLPVAGFEDSYEVSSLGRVRALPRMIRTAFGSTKLHAGGIMKPVPDKDGYPRVILRVDGKHYTRRVHRLVCEAFHGHLKNVLHCEVDHIDFDRANARADNLRWVSHGQNMVQRRQKIGSNSPLTHEQVREIKASSHLTARGLAERHGVKVGTIYDIWSGKRWGKLSANAEIAPQNTAKSTA